MKPEVLDSMVDEEEVEPDSELQMALARARRMRFQQEQAALPKVCHYLIPTTYLQ